MLLIRSRRHPNSLKCVKSSSMHPSLIANKSNANVTRVAINNYLTSAQTRCDIGGVALGAKVQLRRNKMCYLSVQFQRIDSIWPPLQIFIMACEKYLYNAKFSTRHKHNYYNPILTSSARVNQLSIPPRRDYDHHNNDGDVIHFKQTATSSYRWFTFMPARSSFWRPAGVCPWPFSVLFIHNVNKSNNYYSRRQSSYVC